MGGVFHHANRRHCWIGIFVSRLFRLFFDAHEGVGALDFCLGSIAVHCTRMAKRFGWPCAGVTRSIVTIFQALGACGGGMIFKVI
jgi:hypothetical protein